MTAADRVCRLAAVARVGIIYRWRHGRWPSLAAPRRFTEWVQWRKLNDRHPERSRLTDKSWSKHFAASVLGDKFVVSTLWQGRDLPETPPWPMPFVVKSNHGCGQWIVVRGDEDYRAARTASRRWLTREYGAWLDEYHYRGAERSILVERYVGTGNALPVDYKFYVFGGELAMVQVHHDRAFDHRWSQFDPSWRGLSRGAVGDPPASLAAMIEAAEAIGRGHDFVRVDLYEVDGAPMFGEFCLYPGSGLDPFDPDDIDWWLGSLWIAEQAHERVVPVIATGEPSLQPSGMTARA